MDIGHPEGRHCRQPAAAPLGAEVIPVTTPISGPLTLERVINDLFSLFPSNPSSLLDFSDLHALFSDSKAWLDRTQYCYFCLYIAQLRQACLNAIFKLLDIQADWRRIHQDMKEFDNQLIDLRRLQKEAIELESLNNGSFATKALACYGFMVVYVQAMQLLSEISEFSEDTE